MASITISTASPIKTSTSAELTGEEKLITVNSQGKPTAITVNQIIDRVDDNISENIETEVMDSVNAKIESRIEEAIDNANNLKWTNVYGQQN